MECIEGQIGVVKYHKTNEFSSSGNKFIISKFTYENNGKYEDISIKGEMNTPVFGWRYKLYGQFSEDSKYGKTFTFESFEPILAKSHEGMADYLARSVPAIGKIRARLIVDKFGDDTFSILKTDPSRLREVPNLPRMAREQAEEFFASDNALEVDPVAYARLYDLLSPIRPPRRIIKSLLQNFGSNAPQFITDHPYRLLDYPGMGWLRVDRFAVEVLKYNPEGIERHKKGISEILSRNSEHGHTKIDESTLYCNSTNLLGVSLNPGAIGSLKEDEIIISEDDYISSSALFNAERSIAREIERIQSTCEGDLDFDISEEEFDEEQKQIPSIVKSNGVCIITGVPGSGKSWSVANIVKHLYDNGITSILVIAPTGKASKRNDEFLQQSLPSVKIPCSTIHRALGGRIGAESEEGIPQDEARLNRGREQFYFEYGRDNKLPYEYFIIDEMSMVDVSLFASLLEAIPDGSRVLLVGDRHQLSSVGPGSVLRDLIAAEVPTVVLDKPRRNSGAIAQACYQIKEGKNPDPKVLNENWTHVERNDDNQILDVIREIHIRYIAQNSIEAAKENLQVIAPEKKGILGCHNLNRMLGSIMNPGEAPLIESKGRDEDGEAMVRLHDKVVRNKNAYVKMLSKNMIHPDSDEYEYDYNNQKTYVFNGEEYFINECAIVNGDGGEVEGFKGSDIIVRFSNPDRLCVLPRSESHISLAYALTTHKCQGSGFPIVIMPLPVNGYYWNEKTKTGLFSRELLYTSFSRPIERLITVGSIKSVYKAIGRITIDYRKTRLTDMILKGFENENIQELRHSRVLSQEFLGEDVVSSS
jgi:exodeoxyribonuclease V alpha subunit